MTASLVPSVVERVEAARQQAARQLNPARRSELGQFFTPAPLARLMGAMLPGSERRVALLEAGAGIGSLLSAAVEALANAATPPEQIMVTAYEVDRTLLPYLEQSIGWCQELCAAHQIGFQANLIAGDFIAQAVEQLRTPLFSSDQPRYNAAILNPPYKKLRRDSAHRRLLSSVGIETSNLYTAFLALTIMLLAPRGRMVAITPRSFCNGPYFRPFRALLLREMALQQLHLFESREQAFQDDAVLQENMVLLARKASAPPPSINITVRRSTEDAHPHTRLVPYDQVIVPNDPEQFIRFVADSAGERVANQIERLPCSLRELGLAVSTGRVVDFRAAAYLRPQLEAGTTALIYPTHVSGGVVNWPKPGSKKPNAIIDGAETAALLLPNERYVLVKRFSAKEERRRVTAAVYEASIVAADRVGFENHLNYFHCEGRGLDEQLARGLAAFLNSTLVDVYVRQFNGHTQVNATDLRTLRYPSRRQLLAIGEHVGARQPAQSELDRIIDENLS